MQTDRTAVERTREKRKICIDTFEPDRIDRTLLKKLLLTRIENLIHNDASSDIAYEFEFLGNQYFTCYVYEPLIRDNLTLVLRKDPRHAHLANILWGKVPREEIEEKLCHEDSTC